jgi:mRNA export factor
LNATGAGGKIIAKMSGLFGSSATNQANTLGDLSKDILLNNGPEDSISDLRFSPTGDFLAVASWDKKVRIYEVNASGGEGKALFEHELPVFSCDWSKVSPLILM